MPMVSRNLTVSLSVLIIISMVTKIMVTDIIIIITITNVIILDRVRNNPNNN